MKKQVSVFGLHARAALNRLLPVVLGLLVVEGIFAGLCIAHGAALTLSGSNLESALHYSFRAGILALQLLLHAADRRPACRAAKDLQREDQWS